MSRSPLYSQSAVIAVTREKLRIIEKAVRTSRMSYIAIAFKSSRKSEDEFEWNLSLNDLTRKYHEQDKPSDLALSVISEEYVRQTAVTEIQKEKYFYLYLI